MTPRVPGLNRWLPVAAAVLLALTVFWFKSEQPPDRAVLLRVVDGDPSTDITALSAREPVAVLKGGQVVTGSLPG